MKCICLQLQEPIWLTYRTGVSRHLFLIPGAVEIALLTRTRGHLRVISTPSGNTGTYQHFPRYRRWRQSMHWAAFHNTAVSTPCSAQTATHPRVQIRHTLLCNTCFPFITISPLLSFSNANGPVSFVLYFVLHVTFLLPITPVSTADWLVPSASSAFALEHSKDSAAEIALPALPPARAG